MCIYFQLSLMIMMMMRVFFTIKEIRTEPCNVESHRTRGTIMYYSGQKILGEYDLKVVAVVVL